MATVLILSGEVQALVGKQTEQVSVLLSTRAHFISPLPQAEERGKGGERLQGQGRVVGVYQVL